MTKPILLSLLLLAATGISAADYEAVLHWSKRVELGTTVTSYVTEVPVSIGQRVQRGDLLVQLDDREFKAQLQQAAAAVKRARLLLEEAGREQERAQEMYDLTMLSEHDLRMTEVRRIEAEEALQQARLARTQAELRVERCSIRAPQDAIVVDVPATPGQAVVNQLQLLPLVTIAIREQMWAVAQVDADTAISLAEGSPVTVTVRGEKISSTIGRVGLEAAGKDGSPVFTLGVLVPAGNRELRAGERALISVPGDA